jgi:hypothetical protein
MSYTELIPFCIQRAKKKSKDENNYDLKGIDTLLRFDYMGSSEFEWGALPKSLKRIRSIIEKYETREICVNNKQITVFYDTRIDFDSSIKTYIEKLAEGKQYLKEYSDFDSYVNDGPFYGKTTFWWDIENEYVV